MSCGRPGYDIGGVEVPDSTAARGDEGGDVGRSSGLTKKGSIGRWLCGWRDWLNKQISNVSVSERSQEDRQL